MSGLNGISAQEGKRVEASVRARPASAGTLTCEVSAAPKAGLKKSRDDPIFALASAPVARLEVVRAVSVDRDGRDSTARVAGRRRRHGPVYGFTSTVS
jgi:hypothetical protein